MRACMSVVVVAILSACSVSLGVGDEWRLYFDRYRVRSGRYGLATSKDLLHWTDRTAEIDMPRDAHHGTIFRAPRSAVLKVLR